MELRAGRHAAAGSAAELRRVNARKALCERRGLRLVSARFANALARSREC